MASAQLQNIWHLRTVAETSAKSCMVCYKPSTKVLITPDNKDFFYICRGHLQDRGFASAIVDEKEEAAKKRQEELDREIEAVKKEYEEKVKKRKAKKKAAPEKDDSEKAKGKEKEDSDDAAKLEKEKEDKIKALGSGASASASTETGEDADLPRIYALHRNFFQMRLERLRNAEISRRNRERLSNPSSFPSVPSGNP